MSQDRSKGGFKGGSFLKEFVAKLKVEEIDYKRLDVLVKFLNAEGKIKPARRTGALPKQQNRAERAIKQARYLALLPYQRTSEDQGDSRGGSRSRDR